MAGAGDGTGLIIGVGTRADHRTVADAAEALIGHPAGRCTACNIALRIARYRTHCSKLVITTFRNRPFQIVGFMV